ncbi:unnamed protein product, partial [Closterium sp. NIES-54]
ECVGNGSCREDGRGRGAGVSWGERGPVVALVPAGADSREAGGEVACSGARETTVVSSSGEVACISAVAGSWEAAVWQAGVRAVRGMEGMARGALVVGVVVVTDCSGGDVIGDGEEDEEGEVEEEEEKVEEEEGAKVEEEEGEGRSVGGGREKQGDEKARRRREGICDQLQSQLQRSPFTAATAIATASASASAPSAFTVPPRVVICCRPLLSHYLHHAVQVSSSCHQ